jgi:hypothetical protein
MKIKTGILKYTEPILLLVLWIAVFAVPIFLFREDEVFEWNRIFIAWRSVWPFFVLFLINHFLLVPLLLFKNRKATYFISVIIVVVVFSITTQVLDQNRIPRQKTQNELRMPPPRGSEFRAPHDRPPPHLQKPNPFPLPPLINLIIVGVLIIGFDTGLRMMMRWSKLEQEKTVLEKENVQNQLAFLRNQVSPHFFMNTLNNIHALIDVNKEQAKEAIIKLSKLMRHLLYDTEVEKVPLHKELEFIASYANLMKLRFSDKVQINLNIPEKIPAKLIPPLLFTSFVENAFKHGISYQSSSFIDITFLLHDAFLTFEIKNSIPENIKENLSSGIGLENSIKRLDILYGKSYKLEITEQNNVYKLTLSLPV